MTRSATAVASPNIALIKYWGDIDSALRIPANGSISMTLAGLQTQTRVAFDADLEADEVVIQGRPAAAPAHARVSAHVDRVRAMAGISTRAQITSESNFPSDSGIASSAAGFAALTMASCFAAGLDLDPSALSRLARIGSGSACRSIFGGFVEWPFAERDETSYARQLAPPEHWAVSDLIAIVTAEAKSVGSTRGHVLASTSPLQSARLADTPRRLAACREAIMLRDFAALAAVVEQDSLHMHAIMMTSTPSLMYWLPSTVDVLLQVAEWRSGGLAVCATVDAGPNVHCLCPVAAAAEIDRRLRLIPGVQAVIASSPGPAAALISRI
jgi:diphosphomevalonate decarboxylase